MSSPENRPVLPLSILASVAVLTLSLGSTALASGSSRGCRCMLTFSSGAAHEAFCDGFDTTTHARCACEKRATASGSVACVEKASPSSDSVAGDRYERRSHRSR